MPRILLALILFAFGVGVSSPQASDFVTYESITVAGTSIGLSATTVNPVGLPQMRACSARLETAEVRYRFDGTAPTAAEGTALEPGDVIELLDPGTAQAIRFIRTGATSGVLKVHCWR